VAEALRVAVVGMSTRPTCGVRDHAFLLTDELRRRGVDCEVIWHVSTAESLSRRRSETGGWARGLGEELERGRFDAIVLHYSVFSYSHRGIPLFVRPVVAALRRARTPVLTVMHEIAFPWGEGGPRGAAWAASQRIALVGLVRVSAAIVVTADFRAEWLRSRPWLPARPVDVAPVYSNLPPSSERPDAGAAPSVGLFGYALDGATVALVLDAVCRVRADGPALELRLLGAPGGESPAAAAWTAAAAARDIAGAVSFSGVLSAQALADALARCEVLLFADRTGPVSRKGTLAGSISSGRPLVVIEGRRRWRALEEAQAAAIVPRSSVGLAQRLLELLGDPGAREELGARGGAFGHDVMGLAHTGDIVMSHLAQLPRARA
jgi:hypothetical protein